MNIYTYQYLLQCGIYTFMAVVLMVAIVAIVLSVRELFKEDDLEEMTWIPLDKEQNHG